MRKLLPVVVATAAALLLAGCTSGGAAKPTSTATPSATSTAQAASCPSFSGHNVSDSIKVSGGLDVDPTVKIPTGIASTATQRTIVATGTGVKAAAGRTIAAKFDFYDGTSGKQLDSEGYAKGSTPFSFQVGVGQTVPALDDLFTCLTAGSRAVLTMPASAAFGSSVDVTQYGMKATDTVVFVGDLGAVAPAFALNAKATGPSVTPKAGFPTVKLASNGKPTVTVPKGATPSTSTAIELLKKGTGTKVASGDLVTVEYQGSVWRTGKVFDQSWGRAPASFLTGGVVKGFGDALVGQTVGSQVLVTIPPKDGYGVKPTSGSLPTGMKKTDTMVFVIDILDTQSVK